MQRPISALLGTGDRLHLNHGPIDLIVGADEAAPGDRFRAFEAASDRFQTILDGLVQDLDRHRTQLSPGTPDPSNAVARRMYSAARPHCTSAFVTPMIAVAGAVADEVLAAICSAVRLRRVYVNNGGDIAVHLAPGESYSVSMSGADGTDLGTLRFGSDDGIRGIATSGTGGRSHSFGIADSVTVLAATAAAADVAATLIANAVDLPDDPRIQRVPASELQPDSDLRDRLVVIAVPPLDPAEVSEALARGRVQADRMRNAGLIKGAALFLQGQTKTVGSCSAGTRKRLEFVDV